MRPRDGRDGRSPMLASTLAEAVSPGDRPLRESDNTLCCFRMESEGLRGRISQSLTERNQRSAPDMRIAVAVVVAAALAAIGLAVLLGTEEDPTSQFGEGGLVTILSFFALLTAAFLAWRCFVNHPVRESADRRFWQLLSGGFSFFAVDEVLQGHEKLGSFLADHVFGEPAIFRNWNDVIVICYGVVALVVLVRFLPEVLRLPGFVNLLVVGFSFFVAHTAIDSLTDSTIKDYFEESAKLFANVFFALAMATALLGIRLPAETALLTGNSVRG